MTKINCFIPWTDAAGMGKLATELLALEPVNRVVVVGTEGNEQLPEGCESLETEAPRSSETIRQIAKRSRDADYVLLITSESPVQLGMFALERFVSVAADTGAQVLYADFFDRVGGRRIPHPVIDYQEGSLRDDFDFGPLLFLDAAAMREAV
ncbi:MAG: glycosyl transferase, partial [Bacteroidetes bacterium]